jgi:DNA-binding GntR family transcriptional regulator
MKLDTIVEQLRTRILSGEFGTGGRLPSYSELCEQLGTSRETVNKALQLLQQEGVILSRKKSLYVAPTRIALPMLMSHFDTWAQERGLAPVSEFLEEPHMVEAPVFVAGLMNLEPGTRIVRRRLRQGVRQGRDTIYYRISENHYHPELVDAEILALMKADPIFDTPAAVKARHGVVVTRLHYTLMIRAIQKDEQEDLQIARGTPVVEIWRQNFTEDGRVFMLHHQVWIAYLFTLEEEKAITIWS